MRYPKVLISLCSALILVWSIDASAHDLEMGATVESELARATTIAQGGLDVHVRTDADADPLPGGDLDRPIITGASDVATSGRSETGERVMQPSFGADRNAEADKATPQLQERIGSGAALPDDEGGDARAAQKNKSDLEFLRANAISVRAADVRDWDPKQKQEFLAAVKTEAQTRSGQDLTNFAKGVLLEDDAIEAIAIEAHGMRVDYRLPAKFLGIFPASLAARIDVGAAGRVRVRYPWFGFLFTKYAAAADLEADANASLPEIDDEVVVVFEHRARVLFAVSNVLRAAHDTAKSAVNSAR